MIGKRSDITRVLVVDDEALIRWSLSEQLSRAGYEVHQAADGAAALAMLQSDTEPIDLVVLDLKLPDTDGLSLLKLIRRIRPVARVVMMSAFATALNIDEARREGVEEIIPKPFDSLYMLRAVERALALRQDSIG